MSDHRVPLAVLLAYAAPALPLAALLLPVTIFLPTVYADGLGLGFAMVGAVLVVARLWDGIGDPLIGVISDRLGWRWGRRKPLVLLGVPLTMLAVWQLFLPPETVTVWHLGLWSMLLYVGWTLAILPLRAWGAELSGGYEERSRITGWREGFGVAGTLIALVVGGLASRGDGGEAAGLAAMGIAVLVALPMLVLPLAWMVPDPPPAQPSRAPLRPMLARVWQNRSFRRLLLADFVNSTANSLPATLFLIFVAEVLERPDAQGWLLILYFLAGILAIPLWLRLGHRIDKHRVWGWAMLWACAVFIWAPFLGPGDVIAFAVISVLSGMSLGADLALPQSMYADAVDRDTVAGGTARTGLYFSLTSLSSKLALALGVGIAFPLVELFDRAPLAIALLYGGLPVVFKLAAIAIMWRHDLTRAEADRLRQQIDSAATPT